MNCFQAVGGNIVTASPISDLNPLFLASGAILEVQSKGKSLGFWWEHSNIKSYIRSQSLVPGFRCYSRGTI